MSNPVFNKIKDPKTNRWVALRGKRGLEILESYRQSYPVVQVRSTASINGYKVTYPKNFTWKSLLDSWEKGMHLPKPPHNFPANTSYMLKSYNLTQKEDKSPVLTYYESPRLGRVVKEDWDKFTDKIQTENKKSKSRKVTSFETPSGAIVVIPMPVNKLSADFKSLHQFTTTAPVSIQKELWKTVAKKARKILKEKKKIFINTHGLSVPYLHVRIEDDQHKTPIE